MNAGYAFAGSISPCVYTSMPVPLVCSRSMWRSLRSCPVIRIPGRSPTAVETCVISGVPYVSVLALSNSAMQVTPTAPHSMLSATSSSAVWFLLMAARPFLRKAGMEASSYPRMTA